LGARADDQEIYQWNTDHIIRSNNFSELAATRSTTEAEFIAASDPVQELIWLQSLLGEIRIATEGYVECDSRTAIRLIKNPELQRRTEHIDIRYQFIRDLFNKGKFQIEYVSSHLQLAEFLTKVLPINKQRALMASANIMEKSKMRSESSQAGEGMLEQVIKREMPANQKKRKTSRLTESLRMGARKREIECVRKKVNESCINSE